MYKPPKYGCLKQYTTPHLSERNKSPTVNAANESDANNLDQPAPSSANKSSQNKKSKPSELNIATMYFVFVLLLLV